MVQSSWTGSNGRSKGRSTGKVQFTSHKLGIALHFNHVPVEELVKFLNAVQEAWLQPEGQDRSLSRAEVIKETTKQSQKSWDKKPRRLLFETLHG